MRIKRFFGVLTVLAVVCLMVGAAAGAGFKAPTPHFTKAVAVDLSKPVRGLAPLSALAAKTAAQGYMHEVRPERELIEGKDKGFSGDGALQRSILTSSAAGLAAGPAGPTISSPIVNFEGLNQEDNFNIYGFRVNPPDPNAAVGPNHIVEMVNLTFAVYNKAGARLAGPSAIGDLWAGFTIPDCTDASGDPVVLYDRLIDRWVLSQFTTRGLDAFGNLNGLPFYNCVAISQTNDPTGAYYRYAFITTEPNAVVYFPDYPKYGVWKDSYLLTSRDFGFNGEYGISVYALEKRKMAAGDPNARSVKFFLDSAIIPLYLIGDGLLPADIDGRSEWEDGADAAPIVGTMDDGAFYGAPFDGLNIFDLSVRWRTTPVASITLAAQLPVASFDSVFPCGVVPISPPETVPPTGRDCLPQPGVTSNRYLDILSVRQRPTFRLAFRNFDNYQTMVTNQSVEATPGVGGVRWYEIRRKNGRYSLFQQGTYSPNDGIHRWMGSIGMDRRGNIALGYSVVNGVDVFPGIRYTGRLKKDASGQMTLGEGTIINGTAPQRTTNSRWGDYTSLNIDPSDDCTFWYTNEYYQVVSTATTAPWQTRIGSFQLPGCKEREGGRD